MGAGRFRFAPRGAGRPARANLLGAAVARATGGRCQGPALRRFSLPRDQASGSHGMVSMLSSVRLDTGSCKTIFRDSWGIKGVGFSYAPLVRPFVMHGLDPGIHAP